MKIAEFINNLPDDRQDAVLELRKTVIENIPKGFTEGIDGMIHFNIPLSIYPEGYHCTKGTPLPFISIASQKNFIAFYHMGLYADEKLSAWFTNEYPKHSKYKLNMGKSCVRFKIVKAIPYKLIGELMTKVSVDDFIHTYETAIKNPKITKGNDNE